MMERMLAQSASGRLLAAPMKVNAPVRLGPASSASKVISSRSLSSSALSSRRNIGLSLVHFFLSARAHVSHVNVFQTVNPRRDAEDLHARADQRGVDRSDAVVAVATGGQRYA